jgi:hypothetical protein
MDINLTITRGKHQELNLTAKTMNELVEKIKDWQDYEDYVATVKQFKKQPTEEKLKKEKESGWYYIKSVKKLTLTDISQQRELLLATLTSRVLIIQSEPDGIVRETMINNLLVDINCG